MRAIVFCSLFIYSIASAQQYTPYAEQMAKTIMATYPDSMVVMKYTTIVEANEPTVEKNRPAKWNYEIGVVLQGFDRLWHSTGDFGYYKYTKKIIDKFIKDDGKINTYRPEEYNLDNIPAGRQLLSIYQTQNLSQYKTAADHLAKQLATQPRTKADGYWHKLVYPTQMWLDGQYMALPFKTEYANLTGKAGELDDVARHFILMEKMAKDPKTGLLYHGWDESRTQKWANPQTGTSPNFWSRAMGWYIMGLVDVLEVFPKNHPDYSDLVAVLNRTAQAIVKYQDPRSGVWWQVTDQADRAGNYLESSGSAMFVLGLAKGTRLGLLPQSFASAANTGMQGLIKQFVEQDAAGKYHYTKAVIGAGLGGTPYRDGSYDYYIKEATRTDDLKAIGPFMQACLETDLLNSQKAKGKTVVLDNFFNNETKNGAKFHYLWTDRFDSGFSWLGGVFRDLGAQTSTLETAPNAQALKNASVYIIVDPDSPKETMSPNFMNQRHIDQIKKWVKNGGSLLLLANDTSNCEISHFNKLTSAFGISFTAKNRNMVKNDAFEMGQLAIPSQHEIFKDVKKIFVKELVTLNAQKPARPILTDNGDTIMATATFGKGKVFVLGDPWIYNEYVNGRKLPSEYENLRAAKNLAEWLLK